MANPNRFGNAHREQGRAAPGRFPNRFGNEAAETPPDRPREGHPGAGRERTERSRLAGPCRERSRTASLGLAFPNRFGNAPFPTSRGRAHAKTLSLAAPSRCRFHAFLLPRRSCRCQRPVQVTLPCPADAKPRMLGVRHGLLRDETPQIFESPFLFPPNPMPGASVYLVPPPKARVSCGVRWDIALGSAGSRLRLFLLFHQGLVA